MSNHGKTFTNEEAESAAQAVGLDLNNVDFDVEEFKNGMNVELEHGSHDPETDVTGGTDDPKLIAKIAWAHLKEFPDYYKRLSKMEDEAERYWELEDKNIVGGN